MVCGYHMTMHFEVADSAQPKKLQLFTRPIDEEEEVQSWHETTKQGAPVESKCTLIELATKAKQSESTKLLMDQWTVLIIIARYEREFCT